MDVAIIGMSGRFPEAGSVEEFYRNLCAGKDSVRALSFGRKSSTTIPLEADYQITGYLENIDLFDHEFFGISRSEACNMDPQQRLILEVVYEAFENAGYNIQHFNGSNTAVFVGDTDLEYYKHADAFDPTLFTGNLNPAVAGRIARFFNLRGNAQMIDTACSSSLVALHAACNEVSWGEADAALVCGINLSLFPPLKGSTIDIGTTSPDGKARSFSADANGMASGEALGCVLLKPLARAQADGDIIHAVIKATAVNQDAALSGSLTAPDSRAQAEVIGKAWKKAGIDPRTVTYIEAHGTGTKLGDPIEVQGIDLAFREHTRQVGFCALSTVKTNIGHTIGAAGISGLIKAVLALKYRKLFPSLHFSKPNPFIDFENSAVYVNTRLRDWEVDGPGIRRAGVSSFGLSGTNCHVVLEEGPAPAGSPDPRRAAPLLATVTARDGETLRANLDALAQFVRTHESAGLPDIIYTLATGRKHYPARFAAVVETREQLLAALAQPEAGHLGRGEKGDKDSLIFVFSGAPVPQTWVRELCAGYPFFNQCYDECRQAAGETAAQAVFGGFAFQYCFYRLLEWMGVKTKYLLGEGTGKGIIEVIKGQCSFRTGLEKAAAAGPQEPADLGAKLEAFVKKQEGGRVVFAEMNPAGGLPGSAPGESPAAYEVVTMQPGTPHPVAAYVKALYLANCPVDWAKFTAESGGRKIELPTYRFRKTRCWLKEPIVNKVEEWFYSLNWVGRELPEAITFPRERTYVVVMDRGDVGNQLTAELKAHGNTCVQVYWGKAFGKRADAVYEVNPESEADFGALERAIAGAYPALDGLIYLESHKAAVAAQAGRVEEALQAGVLPVFYLTKAFHAHLGKKGFRYAMLTANAALHPQDGQDVAPFHTMYYALLKGIQSEYPTLNVSGIDVAFGRQGDREVVKAVVKEMFGESPLRFTAYRQGKRFVQQFSALAGGDGNAIALRQNGAYLITGGASGIGLEVAKSIARRVKARLIILGRTALPAKAAWPEAAAQHADPQVAGRIKGLQTIEELGSSVTYFAVDVGACAPMQHVFSQVAREFGTLDGIIHSAGLPIDGVALRHKSAAAFGNNLNAKVRGSLLLHELSQPLNPGFCVFFSSLNALVPQKNSADQAVACAFEDGLAACLAAQGKPFRAINWPGWNQVGMSVGSAAPETGSHNPVKSLGTDDGIRAFYHALRLARPNVAIGDIDLRTFTINPFFLVGNDGAESPAGSPAAPRAEAPVPSAAPPAEAAGVQDRVRKIWSDVLKCDAVGDDDDFFELGGHSLNGTQVINRIEKAFGVEIEFEDIFEYPTLAELAAFVEKKQNKAPAGPVPAPAPAAQGNAYDLSRGQQRYYILDQFEAGQIAYNLPHHFILHGKLDKASFVATFRTIEQRHEILRTTFLTEGGVPKQKVHAGSGVGLQVELLDLRNGATGEHPEEKALAMAAAEAATVFDLEKGPLMKIKLLQVEDEKHHLLMTSHHVVTDGWSLNILISEIFSLYNAFSKGRPNPLPPLKVQYKDYSIWQNTQLGEGKFNPHKTYWLNQLAGEIPELELPYDFPRPAKQTFGGDVVSIALDPLTCGQLYQACKARGVTLFMAVTAAVNVLLYKITGQTDIIIGSPFAGRSNKDLEGTIGLFINTLPLRFRFDGMDTFADILELSKAGIVNASAHQEYPFDLIIEGLNLKRNYSRSPLFDVVVLLLNSVHVSEDNQAALHGIVVENASPTSIASKHDIEFYFVEEDEGIRVDVNYNVSLFNREKIAALAEGFSRLLQEMIHRPDVPLRDLPFGFAGDDQSEALHRAAAATKKLQISEEF